MDNEQQEITRMLGKAQARLDEALWWYTEVRGKGILYMDQRIKGLRDEVQSLTMKLITK